MFFFSGVGKLICFFVVRPVLYRGGFYLIAQLKVIGWRLFWKERERKRKKEK